jgi:membrane protease YdiL (CAAX protease family)
VKPAGIRLIALALLAWALCFAALARYGTWLPFAFVGTALAVLAIGTKVVPRELLHPSPSRVAVGVLAGVLMVVLTHRAYESLAAAIPSVVPAAQALFGLLEVTGFSGTERALLIVLIAACEEVVFRGPLIVHAAGKTALRARRLSPQELRRIFGSATAYALATAPLGSPLLVLCAFACGAVWGAMGVVTGSLMLPILAHVIWDVGVLLLWPVTAAHG